MRKPLLAALVAVAVSAACGGDRSAGTSRPQDCIEFPGEIISDLAWAPDGNSLVVGTFTASAIRGSVWLLDWPARDTTHVVVDPDIDPHSGVAAGRDGEPYWYQDAPVSGIWTVSEGGRVLVRPIDGPGPSDIHWTEAGIVGVVVGKQVMLYPLTDLPEVELFAGREGSLRELWASPAGDLAVTVQRGFDEPTVLIRTAGVDREVMLPAGLTGAAALSPDREGLIYEDHSEGRVVLQHLTSGATRTLLEEEALGTALSSTWVLAFARPLPDGTRALCFVDVRTP